MAVVHSKLTIVKMDTSAGALTDISTYCREISLPLELDLLDITTFGATAKQWLPGFADATISLSGPWSRESDAFFAPIYAAFQAGSLTSVSFEYGPEGGDSSDRKYLGEAIMTSYEPGSNVDNEVEWSAEFQVTGSVTLTTY
jgi:hypothetical protein